MSGLKDANKKTVAFENDAGRIVLAAREVKHDRKNKLKPSELAGDGDGEQDTVFLDLGRIRENIEVTAKIDDETAAKLNDDKSVDTFTGDGNQALFDLTEVTGNEIVTVDGERIGEDRFNIITGQNPPQINFAFSPADGASIEVRHPFNKEALYTRLLSIDGSQSTTTFEWGNRVFEGQIQQMNNSQKGEPYRFDVKIRFVRGGDLRKSEF
jgi:hypothetical protein